MSENKNKYKDFECHDLDGSHSFYTGQLTEKFCPGSVDFESLWQMHPSEYHEIRLMGQLVETPRWQQAYGIDYYYTGRINIARPVPPSLEPLLAWAMETIDKGLNGILLNWYDGSLRHYIGRHRDSVRNMTQGVPIVTLSYGEERVFRLRPFSGMGHKDFSVGDGCVFIMPYETNQTWTHEVPHFSRFTGRRISVTLRGFNTG